MFSFPRPLLALSLLTLFGLAPVSPANAQDDRAPIVQNEAIVDFPNSVTFQLELEPGLSIADGQLVYQVGRDSCLSAGTRVPVEANGSNLEWTWVMSRSGNPPPGARMWWEWTFTDDAGNHYTTSREELTFDDDRFDWRLITSKGSASATPISLYWYEGDEVGPVLLEAAELGLERLESDIGVELQGDVQIYVYEDSEDMRGALLYVQDWAGGLAFSDYNTILLGVPPYLAGTWGSDTIRHELAHLVIGQFGRSCLGGSRPTWLEEGLATYAEGEPGEDILEHIEQGIQDNTFQPVRSLNGSFPTQDDAANAAYSQSYSLVDYLLQTYGQEKLQALILELAAANGYDEALENVYGFNADGLEVAWRAAIGAPSRQIPPTPTPIAAHSVPTSVPMSAARSVATPSSVESSESTPAGQIDEVDASSGLCGQGLVPLIVLTALGVPIIGKRRRD